MITDAMKLKDLEPLFKDEKEYNEFKERHNKE